MRVKSERYVVQQSFYGSIEFFYAVRPLYLGLPPLTTAFGTRRTFFIPASNNSQTCTRTPARMEATGTHRSGSEDRSLPYTQKWYSSKTKRNHINWSQADLTATASTGFCSFCSSLNTTSAILSKIDALLAPPPSGTMRPTLPPPGPLRKPCKRPPLVASVAAAAGTSGLSPRGVGRGVSPVRTS